MVIGFSYIAARIVFICVFTFVYAVFGVSFLPHTYFVSYPNRALRLQCIVHVYSDTSTPLKSCVVGDFMKMAQQSSFSTTFQSSFGLFDSGEKGERGGGGKAIIFGNFCSLMRVCVWERLRFFRKQEKKMQSSYFISVSYIRVCAVYSMVKGMEKLVHSDVHVFGLV